MDDDSKAKNPPTGSKKRAAEISFDNYIQNSLLLSQRWVNIDNGSNCSVISPANIMYSPMVGTGEPCIPTYLHQQFGELHLTTIIRPKVVMKTCHSKNIRKLDLMRLFMALITYYLLAMIPWIFGIFYSLIPTSEVLFFTKVIHPTEKKVKHAVNFSLDYVLLVKNEKELEELIDSLVNQTLFHKLFYIMIYFLFLTPVLLVILSVIAPFASEYGATVIVGCLSILFCCIIGMVLGIRMAIRGPIPLISTAILYPLIILAWPFRLLWRMTSLIAQLTLSPRFRIEAIEKND